MDLDKTQFPEVHLYRIAMKYTQKKEKKEKESMVLMGHLFTLLQLPYYSTMKGWFSFMDSLLRLINMLQAKLIVLILFG